MSRLLESVEPFRITEDEYQQLCDDNAGYCIVCRAEASGYCEPDARNYPCGVCGENEVYGAEELLLMIEQ